MTPGLPWQPPKFGSPIFISIPAIDVERAHQFYLKVFNWSFYGDKQPADYSKNDVLLFDFKPDVYLSAGIERAPNGPKGAGNATAMNMRAGTCVYFLVEDVENIIHVIEGAGGRVISEVQKEGTNGLFRYFEDTEGVVNVVYQYVGPLAK